MVPPATSGFRSAEFADAWVDGEPSARWRSATGIGPDDGARHSGSSLLEVEPGCRLPKHTDSAEETIVVVSGKAKVTVAKSDVALAKGDAVLIPADQPHVVRNDGGDTLRFFAIYAGTDVVTTYEADIEPGGERTRRPLGD